MVFMEEKMVEKKKTENDVGKEDKQKRKLEVVWEQSGRSR